jgi:ribose 5-phosphate isomerase A
MDIDGQKRAAAARALEFVEPGMRLGLGTGSTARHFVELLAERVRGGLRIVAVPTSEATQRDAQRLGVPLTSLDETPALDLTVDGADEIAPDLSLIKGGGGALLREKIVAAASDRFVVVVDDEKLVDRLGERFAVPVEVVQFGWQATAAALERLGAEPELRQTDGRAFVTDGGNFILDCRFRAIDDAREMECRLNMTVGVVENGLFIGRTSTVIVASDAGVEILPRGGGRSS